MSVRTLFASCKSNHNRSFTLDIRRCQVVIVRARLGCARGRGQERGRGKVALASCRRHAAQHVERIVAHESEIERRRRSITAADAMIGMTIDTVATVVERETLKVAQPREQPQKVPLFLNLRGEICQKSVTFC